MNFGAQEEQTKCCGECLSSFQLEKFEMVLRRKQHTEIKVKLVAVMSRMCEGGKVLWQREEKVCLHVDVGIAVISYQVVRNYL